METSRPHCDLLNQSHCHSAAQASVLPQVFMIFPKSDRGSNGGMLFRHLKPKGHAAFRELDSSSAEALQTPWPQGGSLLLLPSALTFPHTCLNVALFFVGRRLKHHVLSSFLVPTLSLLEFMIPHITVYMSVCSLTRVHLQHLAW